MRSTNLFSEESPLIYIYFSFSAEKEKDYAIIPIQYISLLSEPVLQYLIVTLKKLCIYKKKNKNKKNLKESVFLFILLYISHICT